MQALSVISFCLSSSENLLLLSPSLSQCNFCNAKKKKKKKKNIASQIVREMQQIFV